MIRLAEHIEKSRELSSFIALPLHLSRYLTGELIPYRNSANRLVRCFGLSKLLS